MKYLGFGGLIGFALSHAVGRHMSDTALLQFYHAVLGSIAIMLICHALATVRR